MSLLSSIMVALTESADQAAIVAKANRVRSAAKCSQEIREALSTIKSSEEYEIFCRLMQQKDVLSPEELLQISYEASKRTG